MRDARLVSSAVLAANRLGQVVAPAFPHETKPLDRSFKRDEARVLHILICGRGQKVSAFLFIASSVPSAIHYAVFLSKCI